MEWQPIETAPYQTEILVRNEMMEHPVRATRGFATASGVCENRNFCTSVFTPSSETDGFSPFPAGNLVHADEWKPVEPSPE